MSDIMSLSVKDRRSEFRTALTAAVTASGLAPATVANYVSQMLLFIKDLEKETLGEAIKMELIDIRKVLDANKVVKTAEGEKEVAKNINTVAARLNAFSAIVRRLDVMEAKKLEKLQAMNKEYALKKQAHLKQSLGKTDIPQDFDAKVDTFLESFKGSPQAAIVAMMAKAAPVRIGSLQEVVVVRDAAAEAKCKAEEASVLAAYGDNYRLWIAPAFRKVKSISKEIEYAGVARPMLELHIEKLSVKWLFPNYRGLPMSKENLQALLQKGLKAAGLKSVGCQFLRRVSETFMANDPTLSLAEREEHSLQMGHSVGMGALYAVRGTQTMVRSEAAQETYKRVGKMIAQMSTTLTFVSDLERLYKVEAAVAQAMAAMSLL